jgi:hypothetical protein
LPKLEWIVIAVLLALVVPVPRSTFHKRYIRRG